MIRSTKYSLGVSYLAGIVQSAVQPFSARSRTAKLLGINSINQRNRCRPSRHHNLLSFPYLSRPLELYADESEASDHNLNPMLNLHFESVRQKASQGKEVTVVGRGKEVFSKEMESGVTEFELESESHRISENDAKIHAAKVMDVPAATQYVQPKPFVYSNEVSERGGRELNDMHTDSVAEIRQASVSDVNNIKSRNEKSVSYKIPGEDESVIDPGTIAYLKDKPITMRTTKSDLLADLGKRLEANNFPNEQAKASGKQHAHKNTSDSGRGDEQYGVSSDQDQTDELWHTQTGTKMQQQRLETLKLKFQDQYYKDSKVQAVSDTKPFQTQAAMPSIKMNQGSVERHSEAVLGKALEAKINTKSLPSIKKNHHVSELDKPVEIHEQEVKAASENKKEIRRQTIYVERKSSVSTSTELPQAFWERSYLGRANLRLYK